MVQKMNEVNGNETATLNDVRIPCLLFPRLGYICNIYSFVEPVVKGKFLCQVTKAPQITDVHHISVAFIQIKFCSRTLTKKT